VTFDETINFGTLSARDLKVIFQDGSLRLSGP